MNGLVRTASVLVACAGLAIAQDARPYGQPEGVPEAVPEGIDPQGLLRQLAIDPDPGGALAPAVRALLEAPYLSEEERRDLRIEHGVWDVSDLNSPERRARAAIIAGAYADASLTDPATPAPLRAEGALGRGEAEAALELLAGEGSLRAVRVRTEALMALARYDEARAAAQVAVDRLLRTRIDDAGERAEGVRVLLMRTQLRGAEGARGGDFRAMTRLLAEARDADPLNWNVRLVEAELLLDKNNLREAGQAAGEVLRMCPRNAEAMRTLGLITTAAFDIPRATAIADEIDTVAAGFGEAGEPDGLDEPGVSVAGAEVRARVLLRQRSPGEAGDVLDRALDIAPQHATLLALRAAAAAVSFDEAARDRWLADLEAVAPGSAVGVYEVGSALAEARQYDEAADFLGRATRVLPDWSRAWAELGLLQVQAGNDAAAEAALETATRLDPFDLRAQNSLTLVSELRTYETIESEHFIIRYRDGIDELLAREMTPVMERIHARVAAEPERIAGGLGHSPDRRTVIELMPDHAWFSVRITGMSRVHTIAAATGPVIAFESPQVGPGFTSGPFDWPRVLQHEYGHTVALSRTRNRVPHWFTEAASVELEDAPRDMNTWRLLARAFETDDLFDLEQINIAFVRPEEPSDRAQAYAQGHWMYRFIMETWGVRTPLNLMDRYAAGENEQSAFEAELGVDRDAFMARFTAWAEDQLRGVGMIPAADAPTVPEMLRADGREDAGADEDGPARAQPDRAFLDVWLGQFPEHPDLLELAARLTLDESPPEPGGRLGEAAVAALETYAAARPVDDWPHRLLARHHLAGDGDGRHAAIPHLAFLDEREQSSVAFAGALARLHAERGEHELAWARAERATRIAPFDADTRELAARVALVAGDTGRAQRQIEALVFLEPDRPIHQRRLEAVRRMAGGG